MKHDRPHLQDKVVTGLTVHTSQRGAMLECVQIRGLGVGGPMEFSYDRTNIHLRYEQARQLPEETLALWLETTSQYVPRDSTRCISSRSP